MGRKGEVPSPGRDFPPHHVSLWSVGGAPKEALSIGMLGPGHSCGSSWGPLSLHTFGPSIARGWCLKASARKSISHKDHCCCHCISWGLRGHWPMMLIGDYKTLGKAKAILKRTFLPSCDLLYLYSKKNVVWEMKGKFVHLDFHSGEKEQWEGERMLSVWLIVLELSSSLSILSKAYF